MCAFLDEMYGQVVCRRNRESKHSMVEKTQMRTRKDMEEQQRLNGCVVDSRTEGASVSVDEPFPGSSVSSTRRKADKRLLRLKLIKVTFNHLSVIVILSVIRFLSSPHFLRSC